MIAALFGVGIAFVLIGFVALDAIDAMYDKESGTQDEEE